VDVAQFQRSPLSPVQKVLNRTKVGPAEPAWVPLPCAPWAVPPRARTGSSKPCPAPELKGQGCSKVLRAPRWGPPVR